MAARARMTQIVTREPSSQWRARPPYRARRPSGGPRTPAGPSHARKHVARTQTHAHDRQQPDVSPTLGSRSKRRHYSTSRSPGHQTRPRRCCCWRDETLGHSGRKSEKKRVGKTFLMTVRDADFLQPKLGVVVFLMQFEYLTKVLIFKSGRKYELDGVKNKNLGFFLSKPQFSILRSKKRKLLHS
jgi:hypothetical protein